MTTHLPETNFEAKNTIKFESQEQSYLTAAGL
jgi:hypothetical protein